MSNYDVSLVNDNMQEFNVKFHGPSDSKTEKPIKQCLIFNLFSSFPRWSVEGSC